MRNVTSVSICPNGHWHAADGGNKREHTHTHDKGGRPKPAANPASHLTDTSYTSVDPHGYAPLGVDCTNTCCMLFCKGSGGCRTQTQDPLSRSCRLSVTGVNFRGVLKVHADCNPVDPLPETRIHKDREPPPTFHSARPLHDCLSCYEYSYLANLLTVLVPHKPQNW